MFNQGPGSVQTDDRVLEPIWTGPLRVPRVHMGLSEIVLFDGFGSATGSRC